MRDGDVVRPKLRARALHASLAVRDLDSSISFFGSVFGYHVLFVADDLADEVARLISRPGLTVRLAQIEAAEAPTLELIEFHDGHEVPFSSEGPIPMGHVAFAVIDIDGAVAAAESAGAKMLGAIVGFPEGRCAYLREPGGAVVEFEEAA